METIRNPTDRAAIVGRLQSLTPATQPRWGKFTASRMICHLADSLRVGLGEIPARSHRSWLKQTLGRWLVIHTPLRAPPARVRTLPEMLTTAPGSWEGDLKSCEQLLERIGALTTGAVHPAFGRLSPAEWGRLAWKHHDHHLRQFGV